MNVTWSAVGKLAKNLSARFWELARETNPLPYCIARGWKTEGEIFGVWVNNAEVGA